MPKDGIQVWDSTNWYCSPPGSKPTASTTASTSTTTETSQRQPLGQRACAAGSSITSPAPTIGTAHSTVSHGTSHHSCTARIAATTRAAPANIDSA